MKRNINRRAFIKNSALSGIAGVVSTNSFGENLTTEAKISIGSKSKLAFNKDGKFKILQIADTHYIAGDPRSSRALENVKQMLDLEKPDLVIHTGDVIFGKPAEESIRQILAPIADRKIPFAVAFGNHDEEYDKTRSELLDIIMSIPYNLNTRVKGIYGETNCALPLSSSQNDKVSRVFYVFDSNRGSTIPDIPKTYGHIHFDQIAWYRQQSEAFTRMNGGNPIPSLAFFHIPLPEYKEAARDDEASVIVGTRREHVASPKINSGLFVSMKEMKDVQATFVGHDHNSDFAAYWNRMFLIYGRFSGCDTVYNDLKPNGARVIELTEGQDGFRSWIRLFGGEIIQNLRYPDDFEKVKK